MRAPPSSDPTLACSEEHAAAFFAETVALDMAPLCLRPLAHIPPVGHLLDAGCGSGRDALVLRQLGYAVTAIEPAPTLAHIASRHCGIPVEVQRFQDIDWGGPRRRHLGLGEARSLSREISRRLGC
jgi:SAM-dependent methyltransferase